MRKIRKPRSRGLTASADRLYATPARIVTQIVLDGRAATRIRAMGQTYGWGPRGLVLKPMDRRRFLQFASAAIPAALPRSAGALDDAAQAPRTYLSPAQVAKLHQQIAAIPEDIRNEFARRHEAWRMTWASVLSDAGSRRRSPEFAALIALGRQILPLLMERIARPDDFFALQAYEVIEPSWAEAVAADGTLRYASEQAKARRAVNDWFAR